jgi:anti-sigma B factor antagonist
MTSRSLIHEYLSDEGCVVIQLNGEFDIGTAPPLSTALIDAMRGGATQIVVDLRDVTFMDSFMLGLLLNAHRRLNTNGARLALVVTPGSPPMRVFDVARLRSHFDIHDDLDGAVALATSHPPAMAASGQ